MKIAIIGTGGIGGYFGAKLVSAGYDVTFIARGKHLKSMQESGLFIKSFLGDFRVDNLKATDKITQIDKPDLIIIGVKAWQIKDIRDDIKMILKTDTVILPLQNGVMASEELSESIDKKHILGGLCKIISKIDAPGVIHHMGVSPIIVFGELDKSKTKRIIEIQKTFNAAGIESKVSENIESDLWKKFIVICVSGLLAVSNTTYGELREAKGTRKLMIDLLQEVFLLSQKIGVDIEEDFVAKSVSFIDSFPYDSTSSLARDVWDKKPSEIEYQNGTVYRLGKKHMIDTPINEFVYQCILPNDLKNRELKK